MFIALEGGDGAGKSTQIPLLEDWFRKQGRRVLLCREPGSTPLGEKIREILLFQWETEICRKSELLLFMAARAQMVKNIIQPALQRGDVVIADRFLLSSIVYQGYGGVLDVEEIRRVGIFATDGTLPDLNFILDVPLDVAKKRRQPHPDRLESETDAFHERVRNGFLTEAQRFPEKNIVISANQSAKAVHEAICSEILKFLMH